MLSAETGCRLAFTVRTAPSAMVVPVAAGVVDLGVVDTAVVARDASDLGK